MSLRRLFESHDWAYVSEFLEEALYDAQQTLTYVKPNDVAAVAKAQQEVHNLSFIVGGALKEALYEEVRQNEKTKQKEATNG